MDSATRIQRYVVTELGEAVGVRALRRKHAATCLAVASAAALAIFAGTGGSGGLVLWPVFGIMNQLLACLTLLVLTTWLAKRGKPVLYTALPMLFLIVTVSYAGVKEIARHMEGGQWHLVVVLAIGLGLEAWMIVEGFATLRIARRVRERLAARAINLPEAQLALAGPTGAVIDGEGVVHDSAGGARMPEGKVC